ncbi:hypothetical protein ACWEWU_07700 [Staphylococcus xylosus]
MQTYLILLSLLTVYTVLLALAFSDVFVAMTIYIVGTVIAIALKDKIKKGELI